MLCLTSLCWGSFRNGRRERKDGLGVARAGGQGKRENWTRNKERKKERKGDEEGGRNKREAMSLSFVGKTRQPGQPGTMGRRFQGAAEPDTERLSGDESQARSKKS